MSKHTPRPWEVRERWHDGEYLDVVSGDGDGGVTVAACHEARGRRGDPCAAQDAGSAAEAGASVPERFTWLPGVPRAEREVFILAKAAIAKARGEAP